jgi:hypothetical protein
MLFLTADKISKTLIIASLKTPRTLVIIGIRIQSLSLTLIGFRLLLLNRITLKVRTTLKIRIKIMKMKMTDLGNGLTIKMDKIIMKNNQTNLTRVIVPRANKLIKTS